MYDVQKHPMHTNIQQQIYRRKIIIYCNANCKTENIIYLLECSICGLQYIGETKQTNGTLLFAFFSLYWMRSFLSIPLALLKQW
jgi:hypothetical protein